MTWINERPAHVANCENCGRDFESKRTRFPLACSLDCRLEVHISRGAPDKCWEWRGLRDDDGYGEFRFDHVKRRAHISMWEQANGRCVPAGFVVMHSCDNPSCCNPSHLSVGTPKDNSDDKIRKGRSNAPAGERSGHSKLTEDQVRAIRADGRVARLVALDYPVNPQAIYKIRRGERWRHLL